MDIINLNGEWTIEGTSPEGEIIELCGCVPGSVLNDIVNSGIEKEHSDIFYRDNAEYFQKYEDYSWLYKRSFILEESGENIWLVFDRLDTYCDVYLNGKHINYCDNGNIRHKFDVSGAVCTGENEIEVYFYSPVQMQRGKRKRRFAAFSKDRIYTRRTQCSYGWDWTMRFLTCGMGDAYLEIPDKGIKVAGAYIYTVSVDEYSAEVGIDLELEDYFDGAVIDLEIYDGEDNLVRKRSKYCAEKLHKFNIDIENPKLWYPNGYGEQNLHTLVIKCGDRELYNNIFGIRTVKILELPDPESSENYKKCIRQMNDKIFEKSNKDDEFFCFTVFVNGVKVMCKGGNWVPCEPYSKGNTDKKVTELLELFAEAGVNMIRVWGGGAFETEHFYNECSRLGMMVSQDFLMACGDYPEEDEYFIKQLRREAEYITGLARNKPCLIWWTGDNENGTWGYDELDWFHGRISAQRGAAPVIYKNDPYRRFFPSSPYGGKEYASNTAGIAHNTFFLPTLFDFIVSGDMSEYKEIFKRYIARFSAEDPTMGAVSLPSLKKFMLDADIFGDDDSMWLYHTKNNPSLKKELFHYTAEFAEKLLGKFKDRADRLFKYKYIQYEWLRISFENARREKEYCSGVLYWMLNDCWPAACGWSLVDYYGIPKDAYYSFKRAAKPIILSVDFEDGAYKVHICNDGNGTTVSLIWHAVSKNGKTVYTSDAIKAEAPAHKSYIALEIKESQVPKDCFIVAEIENGDRTFYKKGALEISPCNDRIEILSLENDCVKVKANTYVHAVEFEGEAVFEDSCFSMLAGEEREIKYRTIGEDGIAVTAYTFQVSTD